MNRNPSLTDFLDSKYLTSQQEGSSNQDLVRLIEDRGLFATQHRFLSPESLEFANNPYVLHLTRQAGSPCGGHWVTFLGCDEGKFKIYDSDALQPIRLFTAGELMTRWDGNAIEIREAMPSGSERIAPYSVTMFWRLLPLAICMLIVGISYQLNILMNSFWTQTTGIVLTSVVATFACQYLISSSILNNYHAAVWMAHDRSSNDDFNGASYTELSEHLKQGRVLIDARPSGAKGNGFIPGSVPIPWNSDLVSFIDKTGIYSSDTPIIAYCNSSNCPWAADIAKRLEEFGFQDVRIYKGGMQDYLEFQLSE